MDPQRLVKSFGDGNNAHPLVRSMVRNNIRRRGPGHLRPVVPRRGAPEGAGDDAGGGDPRRQDGAPARPRRRGLPDRHEVGVHAARPPAPGSYVLCNADEGEPGTFKDRVILTERADLMFEGMTIAGYAIGAAEGILYLRGEYAYLRAFLEDVLAAPAQRRPARQGHPAARRASTSTSASRWAPAPTSAARRRR